MPHPLACTFRPTPGGSALGAEIKHENPAGGSTRHSRVDAEAYDEFGKAMQARCRFVKPILSMVPPDPNTLNPRELVKLLFTGKRFQRFSTYDKYIQVLLMTMCANHLLAPSVTTLA